MDVKRYTLLNDGGYSFLRGLKFPVAVLGYEYPKSGGDLQVVCVKGICLRVAGAKLGCGGRNTGWSFILGKEIIPFEESTLSKSIGTFKISCR